MTDETPPPGPSGGSRAAWWVGGILVACAVLFFIVRYVQPFERQADPKAEDVATAWNDSIARLGIVPVFPPAEDLYVGDVWAVISHSDDSPLLGKAVRVGHIDFKKEILAAAAPVVFSDTADLAAGAKFRKQDPKEVSSPADSRISLTIAAFPGITITHGVKSGGAAGAGAGWFGAQREISSLEEISIKSVETYGIPGVDAVLKLDAWCDMPEYKRYCSDSGARKILAFSVSDKVLATKDGQFTSRIELRLVTRVFLMREIEHKRSVGSAGGGVVQVIADPLKESAAQQGGPKPDEPGAKKADGAAAAIARNLTGPGSTGAKISLIRSDGTDIWLALTPSKPTGVSVP